MSEWRVLETSTLASLLNRLNYQVGVFNAAFTKMLQRQLFLKLHLLVLAVSLGSEQTASQKNHSSAVEQDFAQQV